MVFALAGIATKPADWDPVGITYEKSFSLVYTNVAKYLIEHQNSYEVLSHAGQLQNQRHNKNRQYGNPSWAPDWRFPNDYKDRIVDWIVSPSSEIVAKSHVFLEEYGILICVGQVFDRIHSIGDGKEVKLHHSSVGRVSWNKWHRWKLIEHGVLSHLGTKLGTATSLFAQMHPLTYRRKLAQTKRGTSCLVSQEAEIGDLICQFAGSPIPFILRPWVEDQWEIKNMGPCSRLIVKALEWVTQSKTRVFAVEIVDEKLKDALHAKGGEGKGQIEIRHYVLIGEPFVDGLMNERVAVKGGENQQVAFALH